MAYTPIGWVTGDTITADLLNKMDNGWGVETASTTLLSETVTTAARGGMISGTLAYDTQITADPIIVTFDGTDYTVSKAEPFEGTTGYGTFSESGPVFTTYPFYILSENGANTIYTESAGTYTIKIVADAETIVVSDDFTSAVSGIVSSVTQTPFAITVGTTTFSEIYEAVFTNGRSAYVLSSAYANQPRYIEPVIYVLKASSTFLIKTIGYDGDALAIKTL